MVALISFIKGVPKLLVVLYAIIVIIGSLSTAIRENDPKVFFIDGIGAVVAGGDKDLSDSVDQMIQNKQQQKKDYILFFTVLGNFLILFFVFKIIYIGMNKSFEMASGGMLAIWSFLILFLLQTIYFTAVTGELHIGFTGFTKFFLNLDAWLYPISDIGKVAGEHVIQNPFF